MKRFLNIALIISCLCVEAGWSQEAQIVEDFKLSSVNQPDKQFPQVNSQRRVRAIFLSAIWALHQMIVTKDFSTNSKLANFCMEDLPIMSHIIFFLALGIPTIHILLLL